MNKPVPAPAAPLDDAEFDQLLRLARRALRGDEATRRRMQDHRINIVPCNFYSDIPSIADIESSFELASPTAPYDDCGVFDRAAMADFLAAIDRYADEFDPPVEGSTEAPAGHFWKNPAFSYSDAMAYYCVLRHVKPKCLVEIGSGYSTLVALQALEKNAAEAGSLRARLVSIEPFPMPWIDALQGTIELHKTPVQQLGPDFFNDRLADGDVLMIDSTHTVKAGSDCLHIYLRILPALTRNLTVHAHDIYLPFAMPRSQFDRHIYWTEQYLLYAYLLDNPKAKVLYGSAFNKAFAPEALTAFMRGRWPAGGASIWFSLAGAG